MRWEYCVLVHLMILILMKKETSEGWEGSRIVKIKIKKTNFWTMREGKKIILWIQLANNE